MALSLVGRVARAIDADRPERRPAGLTDVGELLSGRGADIPSGVPRPMKWHNTLGLVNVVAQPAIISNLEGWPSG
jgi:hypothetical protein